MHSRLYKLDSDIVLKANERGYIRICTTKLARDAGLSESSVRNWFRDHRSVTPETDHAIRQVIGAELPL